MNKFTINEFRKQYPDDNACLDYLFNLGHGKEKPCDKCGSVNTYSRVKSRKSYQCSKCRHQIYPMKGTIYEKSRTPLTLWFYSMFLFIKSKNGLSACELQRQTGVTYKTAYRILMHFRASIPINIDREHGTFEVDETFVGGKNVNRHWDKKVENSQGRSFKDKTPVFGAFHRETGEVKAYVVKDTSRDSIQPLIYNTIYRDSHIMSDEWKAYDGIEKYYAHSRVNHRARNYADGNTTTNRIENFWSVFKRTIKGSYIQVSRRHLQRYVNESVFRFNNRNNPFIFQDLLELSFLTPVLRLHQILLL